MGLGFRKSYLLFLLFLLSACGGSVDDPSDTSLVLIDEVTFTDPALKECIREHLTYRQPGAQRVDQLTELECGQEVRSLADLAVFPSLKKLIIHKFSAPAPDVSMLKRLTFLSLEGAIERIEIANHVLLKSLSVHSPHLKTASLVGLPSLESFSASFGQESERVHIEAAPHLDDLYLSNLKETALDLRQLRSLRKLEIHDGQLADFDATLLPNLEELNLYIWSSKPIDLSQNLKLKMFGCFSCSIGNVTVAEHNPIESLKIYSSDVKELVLPSAEYLKEMIIRGNEALEHLELPANFPKLIAVDLDNNHLKELPAAQWPELQQLTLQNNRLTSLSLDGMPKLTEVFALHNQIVSVDLSEAQLLKLLNLADNRIENIDLSSAPALEFLNLPQNKLTDVDVSANQGLVWLMLENNALSQLDVSNLSFLQHLNVAGNQLAQLDVSNLAKLHYLNASSNHLSSIDVSALSELNSLNAAGNELVSLNLNSAAPLTELDVSYNQLPSLDLSGFRKPGRFTINAQHNKLTQFSFPDLKEQEFLFVDRVDLSHNQLQSLRLNARMHVQEAAFNANPLAELETDSLNILSLDISDTLLDCDFYRNINPLMVVRCGRGGDASME